MNRFNKVKWGILVGLLAPLLVIIIIYLGVDATLNWGDTSKWGLNLKVLSPYLRLSLIANMFFFIPYSKRSNNKFLRGLLISTFCYGIIIVIIHFL